MTDRELLELAAKAAGYALTKGSSGYREFLCKGGVEWNPLTDDGDALRLAVKLKMHVLVHGDWVEALIDGIQAGHAASCYSADGSMLETCCRAIVRAAAEIGRSKP